MSNDSGHHPGRPFLSPFVAHQGCRQHQQRRRELGGLRLSNHRGGDPAPLLGAQAAVQRLEAFEFALTCRDHRSTSPDQVSCFEIQDGVDRRGGTCREAADRRGSAATIHHHQLFVPPELRISEIEADVGGCLGFVAGEVGTSTLVPITAQQEIRPLRRRVPEVDGSAAL
ncbi:hypothetical protein ACTD5D_32295 [Nocardia takedensis]|uniref:hypothetical protein n=1 Tax=Nocardia takedensis TaxID=259390 RepID=UPI00146151F0|nr:hypothetical protein [Nocardia takedensis]